MTATNWWMQERDDYALVKREPFDIVRGKVRYYLGIYAELCERVEYGRQQAGDGSSGGGSPVPTYSAVWVEDVCTKADLDRALKFCTHRQREAVKLVFIGGFFQSEAGRLMGIERSVVSRHCTAGLKRMVTVLIGLYTRRRV